MYLFCLTRPGTDVVSAIAGLSHFSTTIPVGTVTVFTAEPLSLVHFSEGRIETGEWLPSRAGAARYLLVRILMESGKPGRVERLANSGRHVYYVTTNEGIFISSHVKLLRSAGIRLEEDATKLPELFQYRHAMPGTTLFKGVRQMQAGETIEFSLAPTGGVVKTVGLFSPPLAGTQAAADVAKQCREALEQEHHHANLDPSELGVLLSGGLDSSILTKIAANQLGVRESYSCAYPFEDPNDDLELQYAQSAAENIGTSHTLHVPSMADYLRGLVQCIWHAEQPVIHLQTVLLYEIFRNVMAPRGLKVVSCGEGADGMFGFRFHQFANYLSQRPIHRWMLGFPPFRQTLRAVGRSMNRFGLIAEMAGRKFAPSTPLTDPNHILWSLAKFGYEPWICRQYSCTRAQIIAGRAMGMKAYQDRPLLDAVSILGFLSEGTETQVVWSLVAEAAGMGVFYPYPNSALIDLAYRIPWSAKLAEPKAALRNVARSLDIGEFIITRPKAAFGIRSERYGPRNSVFEPLVKVASKGVDEALLRSLQSKEIYKSQMLFVAINLSIWRRMFIHGESVEAVTEDVNRQMRNLQVLEKFESEARVAPMIS
jgi:asparagine synthetase B (glutamine-hydrolysing)